MLLCCCCCIGLQLQHHLPACYVDVVLHSQRHCIAIPNILFLLPLLLPLPPLLLSLLLLLPLLLLLQWGFSCGVTCQPAGILGLNCCTTQTLVALQLSCPYCYCHRCFCPCCCHCSGRSAAA
jgi:hypothetical protein